MDIKFCGDILEYILIIIYLHFGRGGCGLGFYRIYTMYKFLAGYFSIKVLSLETTIHVYSNNG